MRILTFRIRTYSRSRLYTCASSIVRKFLRWSLSILAERCVWFWRICVPQFIFSKKCRSTGRRGASVSSRDLFLTRHGTHAGRESRGFIWKIQSTDSIVELNFIIVRMQTRTMCTTRVSYSTMEYPAPDKWKTTAVLAARTYRIESSEDWRKVR